MKHFSNPKRFIPNAFFIITLGLVAVAAGPIASAHAEGNYSAYKRPGFGPFRPEWTAPLLSNIEKQRPRLERARDVEQFCPGYRSASNEQKNNCWVRLATGIMAWESEFKEGASGDGGKSCGLMQIQDMNCRREGITCAQLKTIRGAATCGVRLMGDRISADGVISSELMQQGRYKARVKRLGLARMGWTVMMKSMMVPDATGRRWQAGHLNEIHAGVVTYREPAKGTPAGGARTGSILHRFTPGLWALDRTAESCAAISSPTIYL